ncbi:MAG: rhodanese-like domain-containing protein [Candidatus Binatia bacterium]
MASHHPETEQIPEISREEVLARLRDPSLVLLNVLPREAFAVEHIPGSINLPLSELDQRARELLPSTHQEIAVYCGSFT